MNKSDCAKKCRRGGPRRRPVGLVAALLAAAPSPRRPQQQVSQPDQDAFSCRCSAGLCRGTCRGSSRVRAVDGLAELAESAVSLHQSVNGRGVRGVSISSLAGQSIRPTGGVYLFTGPGFAWLGLARCLGPSARAWRSLWRSLGAAAVSCTSKGCLCLQWCIYSRPTHHACAMHHHRRLSSARQDHPNASPADRRDQPSGRGHGLRHLDDDVRSDVTRFKSPPRTPSGGGSRRSRSWRRGR